MALTKLKKVLLEEGITQKELSDKSQELELSRDRPGVNEAQISDYCAGKLKNPTILTLNKILVALNALSKEKVYTIDDILS